MKNKVTQEMCMIDIPHHPKLDELSRTLFSHYWFRKDKKFHCSNCGSIYEDDFAQCPHCQVRGESRLITKRTNYDNLTLEYRVEVFQVYLGLITIRKYSIIQRIIDLKESIEVEEIERTVIYQGEHHQFFNSNKDYKWTWGWRTEYGWIPGKMNENNRIRRPKQTYTLLPNSFEEALKETEVKYTLIGKYLDESKEKYLYSIDRCINIAAAYPWIEYVYKIGGTKLYKDIVHGCADMRVVRKKTIKRLLPYIKKDNPSAKQLSVKLWSIRKKIELSDEFIGLISESVAASFCLSRLKSLYEICLINHSSIEKMYRYIEKQNRYIEGGIHMYKDYLEMMIKINCVPDTDQLIYPKSLEKAHDEAVMKFNQIKQKANNEEYVLFKKDLQKLEYSNQNLAIVVPDKLEEIIMEGKKLNHCVGSYIDRVVKKETIILFIRKLEDIETPFYTVEFKNTKVIQCRGLNNRNATEEVNDLLKEWESWLGKSKQKKVRMQPSQQMVMQG